jgi:hypothetical protein
MPKRGARRLGLVGQRFGEADLAQILQNYPDLTEIVRVRPELPDRVRSPVRKEAQRFLTYRTRIDLLQRVNKFSGVSWKMLRPKIICQGLIDGSFSGIIRVSFCWAELALFT